MLFALVTLGGCWRPEPYVPPPPPVEAEAEPDPSDADPDAQRPASEGEDAPQVPGTGETADGTDAIAGVEAAPDGTGADPEDVPLTDAFPAYAAHTTRAPVTLVGDDGQPLAVLGAAGWPLEVRGEEPVRVRVWCATCAPPVEGWVQPGAVARDDAP